MAATLDFTCQFNAASAGTGAFVVSSAVGLHLTPAQALAANGNAYRYRAVSGLQWENGHGTYTSAGTSLSRTVDSNSDLTLVPVNFSSAPTVILFPSATPLEPAPLDGSLAFPAGTLMLFQQSAAPVFWTKQATHNDKALRVVSGTASSGGSNSFSSVMSQTTVGSHTLTTGELASHSHGVPDTDIACGGVVSIGHSTSGASLLHVDSTDNAGGGGAHNHPVTFSIQYVDVIICQKN